MGLFIKIPAKAPFDMTVFKARYLELTGENITAVPAINEQETHYLVNSWRLTQAVADQLISEFPLVSIANVIPATWTTKEELI